MNAFNPEALLERRKEKLHNKKQGLNQAQRKISGIRLGLFISIVCYISILYFSRTENSYYQAGLLPLICLFAYFVIKFQKLKRYGKRLTSYSRVIAKEVFRANLNLKELGRGMEQKPIPVCIYQKDLDILGKDGLLAYLDTTETLEGEKKLSEILLNAKEESASEILERQGIIKKFTGDKKATLKYMRLWEESRNGQNFSKIDLSELNKKVPQFFESRKILRIGFKILFTLSFFSLAINFLFDFSFFTSTLFFLQFVLFVIYRSKILNSFQPYHGIFEKVESIEKVLIFLVRKKKALDIMPHEYDDEPTMRKSFRRLSKIMNRMSVVHSPSAHFLLNILFLWDFWVLNHLSSWQRKYSDFLNIWSNEIIFFDSIIPFAHFHFHNPENIFPQISDSLDSISAKNITHPLIPKGKRVKNDLTEIHLGEIDLITGSNMSGKTTYLRTIGINCVLALCGSSVPAESFSLPPVQILTSIRNEDSLVDGISFFYAEVKKMASILKNLEKDKRSLVLLDELLKGTNSRERLIASKAILKKLQNSRAISFVTTHDIDLAKSVSNIRFYHFSEIIENGMMSFDYKIKEGIVKSSNALKILELEGLNLIFE